MPKDDKARTIAFVAYPGLTLLDLVGPMTAFMGLTRGLVSTSREYRSTTGTSAASSVPGGQG